MKIRSIAELDDAIDRDRASRKRAITTLKFASEGARGHAKEVIGSSAIVMLYAHWEGFVKFAAQCYTNYIHRLGLPYNQLANGVVAACLRSRIKGLRGSNKISINRELVELLRDRSHEVPKVPWQASIETYDNLNYEVLLEILTLVGSSPTAYATKSVLLDEKLLRHRNAIAHNGHDHDFDVSELPYLFDEVTNLIDQFGTDVQNAAAMSLFKK